MRSLLNIINGTGPEINKMILLKFKVEDSSIGSVRKIFLEATLCYDIPGYNLT